MAKAELKTKQNELSVEKFIESVPEAQKEDSKAILKMMTEVTGVEPKMWGTSIVGFGNVHLKYESGRELDWFRMGFSPRKNALTLYGIKFYNESGVVKSLGKFTEGKGCIYIKKLSDIDLTILEKLIKEAMQKEHSVAQS